MRTSSRRPERIAKRRGLTRGDWTLRCLASATQPSTGRPATSDPLRGSPGHGTRALRRPAADRPERDRRPITGLRRTAAAWPAKPVARRRGLHRHAHRRRSPTLGRGAARRGAAWPATSACDRRAQDRAAVPDRRRAPITSTDRFAALGGAAAQRHVDRTSDIFESTRRSRRSCFPG